ncbi:MAG: methyltransferase [Bacteroidetes bacterium]|nr:MAG: methyltransferase [Bacteroidota bacterium]
MCLSKRVHPPFYWFTTLAFPIFAPAAESRLPAEKTIFAKTAVLDIIHPLATAYADQYSSPEDTVMHDISQFAQGHPQAHMLSGRVQGKFLEFISQIIQPLRILEIGTFLGYSTLCLAKGLKPEGKLHTIESDEEAAAIADQNFGQANASEKIILHLGNALDIIPRLDELWDLVFIDADKTGYLAYYELVLPKLRPGGLIIADNVLFHGQVLTDRIKGKNAIAIQAFNEKIQTDQRVEKVLLTVRDGLMLIRKK